MSKRASLRQDVIRKISIGNSLITEVHYSDDVHDMIDPLLAYAEKNSIRLTGAFYGREDTNYFVNGERKGLYKVYAPILKK